MVARAVQEHAMEEGVSQKDEEPEEAEEEQEEANEEGEEKEGRRMKKTS